MFGLWRENNLFGLPSIFTRIFLSVCRRLLPTCLPHLLKNWQQVQLVPQKVLQILLIECRICRCNCIFYMYMHLYIHTLTTDFIIDLYLLLLYGIFKSPKLAAAGVHCSSHRGAWREASVCQGESQRSSCHEGSYVSGSKAIQNISKLSLGCLMVMFTLMHPHFFEFFNQLNQFEVRRRRRCKRWVFAMESVARPLKPWSIVPHLLGWWVEEDRLEVDGWTVGPCENSPCRGIEITAPCLHIAIFTSLRFNWLQNYHCVLSHWIIFPSMSEAHPKAHNSFIPNGLKWSVKSRQNPDKISGWVFLLPQLQTYQLCKDKTEKTKEKDREFLYEVKWKDLSPAENTFESVSRCPLLIVQPM